MQTSNAAERVQANLQELFKASLEPGDPYIKFQLTSETTALMSMAWVEESKIITAETITPVPSMPLSVIGIINSRDRVFCVYDLAQLLNLSSSLINLHKYQILVLEVSQILNLDQILYLGLAVQQLQGIIRISHDKIQSPQNISQDINSDYLLGYITDNQQSVPILNPQSILDHLITQID